MDAPAAGLRLLLRQAALRPPGARGRRRACSGTSRADLDYQRRLVRFVENHDEPRAAATFPPARARAAAVATLSQTGARLVHEGQLEGRKVHLPVFLGRRPDEPVDDELRAFYELPARVPRRRRRPRGRVGDVPSGEVGTATRRGGSSSAGAGGATSAQARGRQPRRRAGRGPRLAAVGRPPRRDVASRRRCRRATTSSARATTSATGCTSRCRPWNWHLFDVSRIDSPTAGQPG